MITIRRLPLSILYLFNASAWYATLFWGFDKKQSIRDALPAALGLAVFTTLFLWALFLIHKDLQDLKDSRSIE